MKFITVTELRLRATEVVREIEETREEVVVTKKGKPVVLMRFNLVDDGAIPNRWADGGVTVALQNLQELGEGVATKKEHSVLSSGRGRVDAPEAFVPAIAVRPGLHFEIHER